MQPFLFSFPGCMQEDYYYRYGNRLGGLAPPLRLPAVWPNREVEPYHADGTAKAGE